MPTFQEDLELKLNTTGGSNAYDIWLSHFRSLADNQSHEKYKTYRARLNRFLGRIEGQPYNVWIPISGINQKSNRLFIKYRGRKVAYAAFRKGKRDFEIRFEEIVPPGKWNPQPYRETLTKLRNVHTSNELRKEVDKNPEWRLEAWLADKLYAQKNAKTGTVFADIAPLHYCEMLLQVSSPFSASNQAGIGVKLALSASGHSDILIRRGLGPHSHIGVLELKAGADKNNISKSLCQAFAYAYCYLRIFNSSREDTKSNVLKVLGYGKDHWFECPPPIEAIAVIPKGFTAQTIKEASTRQLFKSEAVKKESIKLFVWEYTQTGEGDYDFHDMRPVTD